MFRALFVVLIVLTAFLLAAEPVAAQQKEKVASAKTPAFVKECIAEFTARYGEVGERYAWAQMFGWGEGVYANGVKFTWFAWSNTDGAFQLRFNVPIPVVYQTRFEESTDAYGRHWETHGDWVLLSNDWIDTMPEGGKKVMNWALAELKKTRAFKSIQVREYLR
jgi:hypothetical protein